MSELRTIVGLFNSASAARVAEEHLLGAGFAPDSIKVATKDTLEAQHVMPGGPTETFQEGIVRFFNEVFTRNDRATRAYESAVHPNSAVVTVNAASDSGAQTARTILDTYGAVDVYKQALGGQAPPPETTSGIDLTGGLSRVRDNDELDDNGLTTH